MILDIGNETIKIIDEKDAITSDNWQTFKIKFKINLKNLKTATKDFLH